MGELVAGESTHLVGLVADGVEGNRTGEIAPGIVIAGHQVQTGNRRSNIQHRRTGQDDAIGEGVIGGLRQSLAGQRE